MKRGDATGAAMALCWAHAEYVSLVRSHKDGVCCDRIEPVYQRFAKAGMGSDIEIWTLAHQLQRIAKGKTLRIITERPATIHWSRDGWATANDLETRDAGRLLVDLRSERLEALEAGAHIVFTFRWQEGWEQRDFRWGLLRQ